VYEKKGSKEAEVRLMLCHSYSHHFIWLYSDFSKLRSEKQKCRIWTTVSHRSAF